MALRQVKKQTSDTAFAPRLRASSSSDLPRFCGTAAELVAEMRPSLPLYVLRPDMLARQARDFVTQFRGEVMYAVKCNAEPSIVKMLAKAGVRAMDAASIEEIRLCRRMAPRAKIYFMHPVKSREAIREAYFMHGVRAFVVDTVQEMHKILHETGLAPDLELFVRLALPKNDKAGIDFSSKFGATPGDAIDLLQQGRAVSQRLGLSFHVGTQTIDPAVYTRAIGIAADLIRRSGVKVDALDVGGGFPVSYPQDPAPPLACFMTAIHDAVADNGLEGMELLCEPGRALVAESGSLIVRVEQRRGNRLYINDGTYGGLFDAAKWLGLVYPVRMHRPDGDCSGAFEAFTLAGPTCDSLDMMEGPFLLPADIEEGDWIEIGNTGAYSRGLRTNFNGFGKSSLALLFEPVTANV